MTVQELKIGDKFTLRKGGMAWIKLSVQGMDDRIAYCQSENELNTRCQRLSYRHRYVEQNRTVFPITIHVGKKSYDIRECIEYANRFDKLHDIKH